jgi:hypothetical protein
LFPDIFFVALLPFIPVVLIPSFLYPLLIPYKGNKRKSQLKETLCIRSMATST